MTLLEALPIGLVGLALGMAVTALWLTRDTDGIGALAARNRQLEREIDIYHTHLKNALAHNQELLDQWGSQDKDDNASEKGAMH